MAIQRTAWIDDDGTGTTGTVVNNAEKTLLYDQIDAALAGYMPVNPSGYLTRDLLWSPDATYDIGKSAANRPRDVFCSRSLTAGGVFAANGFGIHAFNASGTGGNELQITNTLDGAGNYSKVKVTAGSAYLQMYVLSQSYTSGGPDYAGGGDISFYGPGGLSIVSGHPSGAIRFYSGGTTQRGQWTTSGGFVIGPGSGGEPLTGGAVGEILMLCGPVYGAQIQVASVNDVALHVNRKGSDGATVSFWNRGVGVGNISTTASTTAYNTTSDQRLKQDLGLASDVTALRAVVVHDFAWAVDGTLDRGIFAQDTAPTFPRAITVGSDGDDVSKPWMTDYSKFVPDLIVGWQDHDRRLAHLETLLMERTAA